MMQQRRRMAVTRFVSSTIVATLASNMYEIEFSDEDGRTYAELALKGDQLMLLHYRRERAA